MRTARKVKVSISLSEDLLREIDREAARGDGRTRSSVIERWLRQTKRRAAAASLAAETAAYYEALTDEQREDDREWSRFSSAAFERVDDD